MPSYPSSLNLRRGDVGQYGNRHTLAFYQKELIETKPELCGLS